MRPLLRLLDHYFLEQFFVGLTGIPCYHLPEQQINKVAARVKAGHGFDYSPKHLGGATPRLSNSRATLERSHSQMHDTLKVCLH